MRAFLTGVFLFGVMALPITAQTGKVRDEQEVRDLLASESAALKATREQLRQLQQRMEILEAQFRERSISPVTKEIVAAPNAREARNPDASVATDALSTKGP